MHSLFGYSCLVHFIHLSYVHGLYHDVIAPIYKELLQNVDCVVDCVEKKVAATNSTTEKPKVALCKEAKQCTECSLTERSAAHALYCNMDDKAKYDKYVHGDTKCSGEKTLDHLVIATCEPEVGQKTGTGKDDKGKKEGNSNEHENGKEHRARIKRGSGLEGQIEDMNEMKKMVKNMLKKGRTDEAKKMMEKMIKKGMNMKDVTKLANDLNDEDECKQSEMSCSMGVLKNQCQKAFNLMLKLYKAYRPGLKPASLNSKCFEKVKAVADNPDKFKPTDDDDEEDEDGTTTTTSFATEEATCSIPIILPGIIFAVKYVYME